MKRLVAVTKKLRESTDIYLNSLAPSLSTRQLLRISKRLDKYPDSDFYSIVNKACLSQYVFFTWYFGVIDMYINFFYFWP